MSNSRRDSIVVAKEFRPHRQRRLPGIKIDNPAADGELAARGHLRDAFVTGVGKFFEERLQLLRKSRVEVACERPIGARPRLRRRLVRGSRAWPQSRRGPASRSILAREQGEAFGRDFRVGQDIFDSGKLGFGQEIARPEAS